MGTKSFKYKIRKNFVTLPLQNGERISNNFFTETLSVSLKSALMQIRKSPLCSFSYKKYPENFAFLILGILELYTSTVCAMFVYKYTETIEYLKN